MLSAIILGFILSSSLVVLPFELNKINFLDKKYLSTEIINLLFKSEFYTPIQLGSDEQKYFGRISLDDHRPILSESNCEKINLFQNNKNVIKKGYLLSNSPTSKLLGNTTNYLNKIKYVEYYSEQFSYFNTTLIEENKNNILEISELMLIKYNISNNINQEMCLSIGISGDFKVFSDPSPLHFIENLYKKKKIKTYDWTIKFTEQNKGLLIIGNVPHEYENDTVKYSKKNYTECKTESLSLILRPWSININEIYFFNSTNEKLTVHLDYTKFTFVHNFGFIIGRNKYKELIYENYFASLINQNICKLEKSEKTIYNKTIYYIDSVDGIYSMFICDKEKMDNYIKNFPTLYFLHKDYYYVFELTYKDLFLNINNYYYFMIIFPNNETDKYTHNEWLLGLPFLKKYQFIFNYFYRTIGFYKTKNFDDEEIKDLEQKSDGNNNSIIYVLQILAVILLVIIAFIIGRFSDKKRKVSDENYENIEENKEKKLEENIIN